MAITFARSVGFAGQSYGFEGFNYTSAYKFLMERIRAAIATDPTTIQTRLGGTPTITAGQLMQRRNLCISGSAVLAKHAGSAGYWVENDGTTSGPLLTAAVAAIGGYADKPVILCYSHGEQDATLISTFSDAALFKTGVQTILTALRTACNAGTPTNVPVFIDILGIRYSTQETGEHWIRDALIDVVTAGTNVYRGAEKHALRLGNTTHPTRDMSGYGQMGAHVARKVENWLLLGTNLPGPSIASAVRTGNNVAVTITVPTGSLQKPLQPDFFGLFDGSGNAIAITNYSWAGNVLTITGASQPTTFRYPVTTRIGTGAAKVADINRIVRLAAPSSPLYTGEPGLVLESAKAFAV